MGKGTGFFRPRTHEDIAALRQNASNNRKETSFCGGETSAGSTAADAAPGAISTNSQGPNASCQQRVMGGLGRPGGAAIRSAPTAFRTTTVPSTHSTGGRPRGWAEGTRDPLFSSSDSPNSTASLQLQAVQLSPEGNSFVGSWDDVEVAPPVCGSFGTGASSSTGFSYTPSFAPVGLGHAAATANVAGQDVLLLAPSVPPRDDTGVAGLQDSFIPLGGGGTCLQSVSSSSTAQCTFPSDAGAATAPSSYTINTLLQLRAQLAAAKVAAGSSGGSAACADGQQLSACCNTTLSGPFIHSSSGFLAVGATEGQSSAAVTAPNSACSLGWNSFAGNSAILLQNNNQNQLQNQNNQQLQMQMMSPTPSTCVSGAWLIMGSANGPQLAAGVLPPPLMMSAPTNVAGGLPTSPPNNAMFVGGCSNGSLSLGPAAVGVAAAANSSSQHVMGSDVAAVAAALAQDKLAQLQALEDMQQQLRNDVAHLLPLI